MPCDICGENHSICDCPVALEQEYNRQMEIEYNKQLEEAYHKQYEEELAKEMEKRNG